MLTAILAILISAALAPHFYERYRMITAAFLTAVVAGVVVFFSLNIPEVSEGNIISTHHTWVASLHIHLNFYLDGLSLFFSLLVTIAGLLVMLYSFTYMQHYKSQGRFFGYLLFFMGSMLGLVLSANLISLFVFWELTSFSSFLLIGFNNQKEDSRKAARQALLITAGGGLALLAGFIMLNSIFEAGFFLPDMMDASVRSGPGYVWSTVIILIAVGAFTKSAQFPFHFWLPNAMAAPTPVSAYLHSATMVKAGVYLILRLNPIFNTDPFWHYALGITGAVTMTWGALKAFGQDDLKRILAYTTISALGIFFMMTGFGTAAAINSVLVYLLAHALYKGALFLVAGSIDQQAGTRRVSELRLNFKKMPFSGTALFFSAASMAGILPFIGFIGKESLYHTLYHDDMMLARPFLVLLFISSAFFTAIAIEIVYDIFFNRKKKTGIHTNEPHYLMVTTVLILAMAGLVTGVFPGVLQPLLINAAIAGFAADTNMHLKIWHGFNTVFQLSLFTWVSGGALYLLRKYVRNFTKPAWLSGDAIYGWLLELTEATAKRTTRVIQGGYLRNYITIVVITFSVLLLALIADYQLLIVPSPKALAEGLQIYEIMVFGLISMATIFLFRTRSRLIVTATFGIIGFSIALAYTLFSAPDVAITQFLAETLTLILMILILHRLPSYTLKKKLPHKSYLPVAVVFGLTMAIVSYLTLAYEKADRLRNFFLKNSVNLGKGENAVNVILVDFRALDTLGEITVLTVTMLGVMALLRFKSQTNEI